MKVPKVPKAAKTALRREARAALLREGKDIVRGTLRALKSVPEHVRELKREREDR